MIIQNPSVIDLALVSIILTNLLLLGSGRLAFFIRMVAIQGWILGVLTIGLHNGPPDLRVFALAFGSAILKGAVFPWLLARTIRVVNIKRELEPLIGYSASLLIGVLILGLSLWLSMRLPLPTRHVSPFVITVAFFTIFTGCFLIVGRTKAITQVISYLVLENGIYLFGVPFIGEIPLIVELGVILDLSVGIFVMGIIMNHIAHEFDSLNVKHLATLRDWGGPEHAS